MKVNGYNQCSKQRVKKIYGLFGKFKWYAIYCCIFQITPELQSPFTYVPSVYYLKLNRISSNKFRDLKLNGKRANFHFKAEIVGESLVNLYVLFTL